MNIRLPEWQPDMGTCVSSSVWQTHEEARKSEGKFQTFPGAEPLPDFADLLLPKSTVLVVK